MSTSLSFAVQDPTDAQLVADCLAGDRQAYAQIVARYQSLVCSLAYAISGSLQQSEDLAQETFLKGWEQLRDLREPAKLRPWLCTIARHLAYRACEKNRREPAHAAQPLDVLEHVGAAEPAPFEQTITREEESILWRSLESIPENYRAPLVLFYREHRSVERVAQDLELSEDAVRQRLHRGREMLAEKVARFVEGALERTAPGPAFTQNVMTVLPLAALSVQGATLGTTTAKTGLGKTLIPAINLVGPALGMVATWFSIKTQIECARSPREREALVCMIKYYKRMLLAGLALFGVFGAAHFAWQSHPKIVNGLFGLSALIYLGVLLVVGLRHSSRIQRVRTEEGLWTPAPDEPARPGAKYEYRSRLSFLGLPLVHVCFSKEFSTWSVAKGWIAIGDMAFGALAFGPCSACGLVSFGGCALGLIGVGVGAAGALAIGVFAMGGWAAGGYALGWEAAGKIAVAWHAAAGKGVVTHGYGVGEAVIAAHENDAAARAYINSSPFFALGRLLVAYLDFFVWLFLIYFCLWPAMKMRNSRKRAKAEQGAADEPCGATSLSCEQNSPPPPPLT